MTEGRRDNLSRDWRDVAVISPSVFYGFRRTSMLIIYLL